MQVLPCSWHLLELNGRTNSLAVPAWLKVESPLVWQEWARDLATHVDQAFATYILEGIASGFRIGFDYDGCRCQPAASNMLSATQQAGVVQTYLEKEVALGAGDWPNGPSGCSSLHTAQPVWSDSQAVSSGKMETHRGPLESKGP